MRGLLQRFFGREARAARARRLTLPLLLEEGRAPRMFAQLLYFTSFFFLAALIWASVTSIKELALAQGQVQPAGSSQVIQHLEGGMVAEILAHEGEVVDKGQPLVRMQPTIAETDLGQIAIRASNMWLERERLAAMLDGRTPDFGETGKSYPHLARQQGDLMRSLKAKLEKERETLEARIKIKKGEIVSFSGQERSLGRQVDIQKEQLRIRDDLLKEGLVSRAAYLEIRRQYEKTRSEWIDMTGRLNSAREGLHEAQSAYDELETGSRKTLSEELAKVAGELAELREAVNKHKDRVARLIVRAPSRGVVQEIVPKSAGEVIKPGDAVARIVPLGQELVAEVQLKPRDVGHVKVGDPAEVKISTFDPARFGGISGKVDQISASTFQTEKGEPYYKAVIKLDRNHVGNDDGAHPVLPGMVVTAEIITGARSLTHYLLKPVNRSLEAAFIER